VKSAANKRTRLLRIYSEDKQRSKVLSLAKNLFSSFTVHETVGYYQGFCEPSFILEFADANPKAVLNLARKIKNLTRQRSVLIVELSGKRYQVK
jgi:hypothetical protein